MPTFRHTCSYARARARAIRAGWLLAASLLVVLPGWATAASIFNTAVVTYRDATNQLVTMQSNTVETPLLPTPTPATLGFLRYDPTSPNATPTPIDGGQCRVDGGSFAPIPGIVGVDGKPVDTSAAGADEAVGYYVGEPAIITIKDANRNTDPAVREYADVDLTTNTGDAETLRLQETGPDTGVFAGAIQTVAIPPAATQYDCQLSLAAFAQITARYTDTDFPLDALAAAAVGYAPLQTHTVIRLTQTVSKDIVEIGDFLQYTLVVSNIHDAPAVNVRIRDVLPPGLRYRAGSLRVGNANQAGDPDVTPASLQRGFTVAATSVAKVSGGMSVADDPIVSTDGGTFQFPVGNLAPGASVAATFVAEVGAAAAGQPQLLNYAIATANGALSSNETDTVVRMRESLNMTRFTIIGRIIEDASCNTAPDKRKGVARVRLLLEDGTYVASDESGAYHFEGVRPGTHVVQVDPASIPADMEIAPCIRNTRFAGRADSQFVEAQGGSLARADFFLRPKAPTGGEAGIQLRAEARADGLHYTIDLDGGDVPLSQVRAMLMLPEGAHYVAGSTTIDGAPAADPAVNEGVAIFSVGDPGAGWHRTIELGLAPDGQCPASGYDAKVVGLFEAGGKRQQTPPAGATLPCGSPPTPADSGRVTKTVTAAAPGEAASPFAEQQKKRNEILDTVTAGGANVDWLKGQAPGTEILFPAPGYNPRAPATRVVVKRAANQTVALRVNGGAVDPLLYDGARASANGSVSVDVWSGIPLKDGDNTIEASVLDASGATVATLSRKVRYATLAARTQFVPEQSILVADGVTQPVIAVRILDAAGHPLHEGLTGDYAVSAPYEPARDVSGEQQRAFAGLERARPTWRIEGDEGIAYIELEPTSVAGNANLSFRFGGQQQAQGQAQQVQAWLKSAPRDWIVVGFAKGSIGYETLKDNLQALQPGEDGKGVRADGQAALYAKGRVLGKWLLTLSYDSDKPTDRLRNRSLLSTIDPGQYYTLYGDGSQQGYDASSARKLYLKLERDQFYALFGDFDTGMGKTELSRYQRTLNGVKVEYHGPMVEFTAFGAKTAQSYARDEIQGDGTSGLYRLRRAGIVLNSERITIETRDRYHSEQIVASKDLVRHIDYDIDYDNGTLFFREPIASRDFDLNPNWIVAEYETRGTSEEFLDAGGRVGVKLMGDRLEAGASYISDDGAQGRSQLVGVDAKFRISERDEVRAEAATSRADAAGVEGNAWLVEWTHRTEAVNLLAYTRRQAGAFGLGQQNASEGGMLKMGVQGQYRIDQKFSLQGEVYRLENLADDSARNVAQAQVEYRGNGWKAKAGLQWAHDEAADGEVAESRQVMIGADKSFFGNRLSLGAELDFSLPGKNESVDFPTRLTLNGAYKINDRFRVLAAQEFTDGKDRDTSTTRVGFEAKPWKDATLTSTFNQSQISEYGPRTFALFGLDQKFAIGKRWTVDAAVDSSQAFNQSGNAPLVVDPSQPIQAGGIRDGGALTENFVAVSGGATYRADLWSWNARVEARQSDSSDRYGFTTAFLRQVKDGVALSASAQAFSQLNADGSTGILADAQASFAWRPLGSEWSMLDKFEYHLDSLTGGTGQSVMGQASIAANGDARSARLVNNFVLNYASDAWRSEDGGDGKGSVLDLYQRSQLSLYYGSKYVLDSYDGDDYAGYTDILGVEARYDLTSRIDVGLRASVLHSWSQNTYAWAFGPSVGFTPFTNAWVSVGYNIRGFNDRDFESSHYTAKGAYLVFRMKFDQHSLGLDRASPAAAPAGR